MIDPTKILRFLESHFDRIKLLYGSNKAKGFLSFEEIERIFESTEIVSRLEEYQIIEEKMDGNFTLRDLYYSFIEGLLDDYALDMPAQISKYNTSLNQMYTNLQSSGQKNETIKLINALNDEIHKFEGQLKRNIKKLIQETQKIKANNEQMTFKYKLQKASELTKLYVDPINKILSNHEDAIYNLIKKILQKANHEQYINKDNDLKHLYKKLYELFSSLNKEILNENRLLINEVVPLLERIKTESIILSGFINYLEDPNQYTVPNILDTKTSSYAYKFDAYYDARDVWDGYCDTFDDVILGESEEIEDTWIYEQEKYLEILYASLPNKNFYGWVHNILKDEVGSVESRHFLQLSKLILFTPNLDISYTNDREDLILEDKIFNVPIVHLKGA